MDKRHVAVMAGTTSTATWMSAELSVKISVNVQWIYGRWPYCWYYASAHSQSRQEYMCNEYTACGCIVKTSAPGPSVSEHRPSRLVWMCNGYPACEAFVGTSGHCPSVGQHRPPRLVWLCNGYHACCRIVGTTGTGPSISAHPPSRFVWMCNGYSAWRCIVALGALALQWVHVFPQD